MEKIISEFIEMKENGEITDKEFIVLTALAHIVEESGCEEGFSDIVAGDLIKATGYNGQQIGGIIASLENKGLVEVVEEYVNWEKYNFIHLAKEIVYRYVD